jgi:hypothetical protein
MTGQGILRRSVFTVERYGQAPSSTAGGRAPHRVARPGAAHPAGGAAGAVHEAGVHAALAALRPALAPELRARAQPL